MTTPWSKVARSDEVVSDIPYAAATSGIELVLLRTKLGLRAFEGRCPHRGALLGEGDLDGAELVCRNHQWRFNVETGKRDKGTQCLRSCPVREESGNVEVDVSGLVSQEGSATKTRAIDELPGPKRLPLIGSAHLLPPHKLHLGLEQWAREFGTPYCYRFGPRSLLVLGDMDDMTPAFRERPDRFRRTSNLELIFEELGVNGVFSAEGKAWRPQRRLAMEALSQRHLRGFYPTLKLVAERLRARWMVAARENHVLDLAEELKRFTVDVTTLLAFGYDINTLEKDDNVIQRKLELMFPAINRRLFALVPWWRFFRLPADRRVDKALDEVREWIGGLVAETRERLSKRGEGAQAGNFLEAMIAARDEEGRPFDDATIFGNAMTMLLAGEDTTAYTLAWAVHHLLEATPEVDDFRRELHEVLGDDAVPRDIETASRLSFGGAIANEAMRLRPVAPVIFLDANEDTTIGDIAVPKGTTLVLLIRRPAVDASNFVDPDEFRPTRWLTPGAGPHDPAAHQPFGSGPRVCPGRTLALLEMKVVLGTLYKNFDVERVGAKDDVKETFAFTMTPEGLRVRLRARDGAQLAPTP